jgi:hypothetical protein
MQWVGEAYVMGVLEREATGPWHGGFAGWWWLRLLFWCQGPGLVWA